jgi:hypothetical protein
MLIFTWVTPVYAASRTVSVKVAEFPVTLNGIQLGDSYLNWLTDNNYWRTKYYAQYPLLVYKDITYFPMTWYLSNLLNLKTTWSEKGGLSISPGDPDQWKQFSYDSRDQKNNVKQTATIVNFTVTVNGKVIDNSKEKYPLLLFRDITYFPLTWRFAVEEFGWRYAYSDKEGLRMDADNSVYYLIDVFDAPDRSQDDQVFYDSYIKGDLKIWIEYRASGHAMGAGRMYISQGGKTVQVGDGDIARFSLWDPFEGMGRFRVEGNWIYTWYADSIQNKMVPARVNILTKEIEVLE